MKTKPVEFSSQYCSALKSYLDGGGEVALQSAYEIGRQALNKGLGILEMASFHHEALKRLVTGGASAKYAATKAAAVEKFFVESLTPFEMTHRGFREANAALRASEERYRELFENANDIVFTTDLEGNITSINRAGERLTGYSRDETPLAEFAALVPRQYVELARGMAEREAATPTPYEIEFPTKSGKRVPLSVSIRLVLHQGKPAGVQGIARDMTERILAQQALRQFNEALEEQAKLIAHALHDEAGQLLATVHISLEDAISQVPSKDRRRFKKVKDYLYEIEDHLRHFSHELRPTVLDDLGLKAGLEFLATNVSKRTGISVSVEYSLDQRLPVPLDTALYRITQEALTNITRHAQAKNAILKLQASNGKIVYTIKDDGRGFDPGSILAKRGDRGLGLAGIQMRLDAFGGSFSINSVTNKGSELWISIPVER